MEATRSSETSVYNKPTRRHIPEDSILQEGPSLRLDTARVKTFCLSINLVLHLPSVCLSSLISQVSHVAPFLPLLIRLCHPLDLPTWSNIYHSSVVVKVATAHDEWRYSSIYYPRPCIGMSGQRHAPADLPLRSITY
jgi:hypothetical protein